MRIVGPEPLVTGEDQVHTIDIWFSPTRNHWMIQRLNGRGDPVGPSHRCRSKEEAVACLTDWMRRHPETHLTPPHAVKRTVRRLRI